MMKFRKSILIISASPGGLEASQVYLLSRGWDVKTTDDLKEAMQALAEVKPEAVLICMDHPNKNINMLPKLILERVRCCVIATAQKSTLQNYTLIHATDCEYKLFPPSSGPAIERTVSKYAKKLSEMMGTLNTNELKRSGISPKIFKLNVNEKPDMNVMDYSNFTTNKGVGYNIIPEEPSPKAPPAILVRGAESIIADIIEPAQEKEKARSVWTPIQSTTNMTCMQIECQSFQGYLVAALGKDCRLDDTFVAVIHKHLVKFLEEQGEKISSSDIFQMQIKPVAFLDWAEECGEFLKKSIHKGNEIAFAFFPFQGVRASYESSASDEMISVPIDELYGDTKVGFDVYIFFPTNNKYVLYTPANSVFYTHQQQRLLERGIATVHLKRTDIKELNRYRAQRYFNAIIEEYNSSNDLAA
jgi:hypothetical protein